MDGRLHTHRLSAISDKERGGSAGFWPGFGNIPPSTPARRRAGYAKRHLRVIAILEKRNSPAVQDAHLVKSESRDAPQQGSSLDHCSSVQLPVEGCIYGLSTEVKVEDQSVTIDRRISSPDRAGSRQAASVTADRTSRHRCRMCPQWRSFLLPVHWYRKD